MCSNKNNYSYNEDDVKQIFSAIDQELKMAKTKFQEAQSNKKELLNQIDSLKTVIYFIFFIKDKNIYTLQS